MASTLGPAELLNVAAAYPNWFPLRYGVPHEHRLKAQCWRCTRHRQRPTLRRLARSLHQTVVRRQDRERSGEHALRLGRRDRAT
jgi:hypothetical protein